MNQQDKQAPDSEPSIVEDLTVNQDQAAEVKGGPIYMKIDGVKGDVVAEGLQESLNPFGKIGGYQQKALNKYCNLANPGFSRMSSPQCLTCATQTSSGRFDQRSETRAPVNFMNPLSADNE